ncbi:hypothetical protein K438DRAFT_1788134 [Mycena galopus ATCC 62051]|nr:hypothetical protein K438DRAFT_1788134 [Mycena galopus ATCC 62051]
MWSQIIWSSWWVGISPHLLSKRNVYYLNNHMCSFVQAIFSAVSINLVLMKQFKFKWHLSALNELIGIIQISDWVFFEAQQNDSTGRLMPLLFPPLLEWEKDQEREVFQAEKPARWTQTANWKALLPKQTLGFPQTISPHSLVYIPEGRLPCRSKHEVGPKQQPMSDMIHGVPSQGQDVNAEVDNAAMVLDSSDVELIHSIEA